MRSLRAASHCHCDEDDDDDGDDGEGVAGSDGDGNADAASDGNVLDRMRHGARSAWRRVAPHWRAPCVA
jgi:hypothetical protein